MNKPYEFFCPFYLPRKYNATLFEEALFEEAELKRRRGQPDAYILSAIRITTVEE
jgi:hypothetical protein